jgi:hypothetical protein
MPDAECLTQVSTRTEDFLVDLLALREHVREALGPLFLNPKLLKVLHGADSDVQWLQRDFGIYVVCTDGPSPPSPTLHVPAPPASAGRAALGEERDVPAPLSNPTPLALSNAWRASHGAAGRVAAIHSSL